MASADIKVGYIPIYNAASYTYLASHFFSPRCFCLAMIVIDTWCMYTCFRNMKAAELKLYSVNNPSYDASIRSIAGISKQGT